MTKRKKALNRRESDPAFVLKIVMYLIIGTQWVRLVSPDYIQQIPIPVGFIVGILFAMHDHFRIDRKIEYAVLTVAMLLGFWLQSGIYITIL